MPRISMRMTAPNIPKFNAVRFLFINILSRHENIKQLALEPSFALKFEANQLKGSKVMIGHINKHTKILL